MSEILVVGAGPTGTAAALAYAKKGARVRLVEGRPAASQRFAGEWLHPPGVRALQYLGVDSSVLGPLRGDGIVLMAPGEEPVEMPYARGFGVARVHHELVEILREQAASHPLIEYLPHHSLRSLDGNLAGVYCSKTASKKEWKADRIIGADGRNSNTRSALGLSRDGVAISYMMGIDLHGCRMPFEGQGHVIAGGPGPGLFYRVGDDIIRGCLDVPQEFGAAARKKDAVYRAFAPVLPPEWRSAFKDSLQRTTPWAGTRYQARQFFGLGSTWLAGDAVGHVHPITGMGMTLGILDAVASAEASTLQEYRVARQSHVVELLTNLLYHVFQRTDESARRIRGGLLAMLRENQAERLRTMNILTGEDERSLSFASSFLRASRHTLEGSMKFGLQAVLESPRSGGMMAASHLKTDIGWLKWPLGAILGDNESESTISSSKIFRDPLSEVSSRSSFGSLRTPSNILLGFGSLVTSRISSTAGGKTQQNPVANG
ncbi:MAG: FAD-dependent monooxygenase [Polyangiaceae bacterium]|nr:FAD-dependent monooxygenase [Polyangiaceae bacterium]